MLNKKSGKEKLEKLAIELIMSQKDEFNIKDIMMNMRVKCDDSIDMEEIEDVVFNAVEFCLGNGIIDIFDEFSFMVDPIQQINFENNL